MKTLKNLFILLAVLSAGFSCLREDFLGDAEEDILCGQMNFQVSSNQMQSGEIHRNLRGTADARSQQEMEIHQLYLFFFDAQGEYLRGNYIGTSNSLSLKYGFLKPGPGLSSGVIDNDRSKFEDLEKARHAQVYVVANVEPVLFSRLSAEGFPENVRRLSDLEKLVYAPDFVSEELPENGMPMSGYVTDIDLTAPHASLDIRVTALMARLDFSFTLESAIIQGEFPKLYVDTCVIRNQPMKTRLFGEPQLPTAFEGRWLQDRKVPVRREIRNGTDKESIALSFYSFRNLQPVGQYPAGYEMVPEQEKAKYKPLLANGLATHLQFGCLYSTYDDSSHDSGARIYEVIYTLYPGGNAVDNFQIHADHRYDCGIGIRGLKKTDDGSGDTFDARVHIDESMNNYYLSILRERDHDAHFCVTPMDVFLFQEGVSGKQPSLEVILGECAPGSDQPSEVPDWIRMELIPAACMAEGSVPPELSQTNVAMRDLYGAGAAWMARNGIRNYFTAGLLDELGDGGLRKTLRNNRDRIYFYIDENLEEMPDPQNIRDTRKAKVTFIYRENGVEVERSTMLIGQRYLIPVQIEEVYQGGNRYTGDGVITNSNYMIIRKATRKQTVYVESVEEYLDYFDPLDEYTTAQKYPGLSWGPEEYRRNIYFNQEYSIQALIHYYYYYPSEGSVYLSVRPCLNFFSGLEFTNHIIERNDYLRRKLYEIPRSAVEYCYNRNKRNADGTVSGENRKWFLPGISQVEQTLLQLHEAFPEFEDHFYWSSAPGEEQYGRKYSLSHARATEIRYIGGRWVHVSSGNRGHHPDEGHRLRSEKLRIRAFRSDLLPVA